jgi:hypothetical protein
VLVAEELCVGVGAFAFWSLDVFWKALFECLELFESLPFVVETEPSEALELYE